MMLSIKRTLLIVILMTCGYAYGQEVLTLDDILAKIKENNPALRAYENLIKSQDAKVEGSGAWMPPMVGAGTFMTPYPGQRMTEDNDRGALMLSAEQDIPNPFKIKAKREYLMTQSLNYVHEKAVQYNEFRARARELYYSLMIANKRIGLQKENQQIMQTMKKLAEIRYPFNQGSLSQVFKAEGRFYESENMILMTQGEIRSKKIALNVLMNRPANSAIEIDTSYKVSFNLLADLDTVYLAGTRSDILHMEHNIYAIEKNINQIRQEAKPDFRIRFDHMSNYSAMMPRQFTIMGMLSVPIAPWSSKMYKSEIKSMSFEREAMRQRKEAMLLDVLGMTRAIGNDLSYMQKQIGIYESKILPALNKNLKVSMLSYQENKSDLNSVIDAWEALNMSQMAYLDQLHKFYQMIAEYEKNIER